MKRLAAADLDTWLNGPARRPLVLRGSRQVGKTWLVRDLAQRTKRELVELNFEREPALVRHFASNDPRQVLAELSLALGRDLTPEQTLLFLDEIQAGPQMFAKLRWFAEELPELPVIAAGSLLELALGELRDSVPVGRLSYSWLEPLGFSEFLEAHAQTRLLSALSDWSPGRALSPAAHEQASNWFQRYAMVGGMPAVVAADVAGTEPRGIRERQRELIQSFRDDFAKYSGRLDRAILDGTLLAVAAQLGQKFVYARTGEGVKQHQAKRALELLSSAGVCHLVRYSAANGLPLGGQVKDTFRKAILLDAGLFHALIGTPVAAKFPAFHQLAPAIRAQLTDQLAGQGLRLLRNRSESDSEIYYWQREGGRPGEVDYLIELGARIVPVELKAGAAGSMKSLHQFMHDKKLGLAARLDTNPPSSAAIDVRTTQGDPASYRLVSLPHYLTFRLTEALEPPELTMGAPPTA
jgi:uncharacterized protein